MEETHPSFLRTSTDLLIPVSKIMSRPIGVGTTKDLLVSPNIGYNYGIFVCCHHFIDLLVSPNIGYNYGIFVCCHHFIYCWYKGDPLLPFLFKLRFSSALRDGIGVFKPISLFH